MNNIAFIFSGQGAQYTGMGRSLYERSPAARAVFDMADAIRPGTSRQCFEASAAELSLTRNTQPCLFCVDLAAAAALSEAGVAAHMLAGFSLGELAALAYSGALTWEDAFRLVCDRARYMQEASEKTPAAMAAVLRLEDEAVIELCGRFEGVWPVNFNCPGQVVVSGTTEALAPFQAAVKEAGGKAMLLKVSGGFHSPFMEPAAAPFAGALEEIDLKTPCLPLYSNVTALPYGADAKSLLARQITSPVLWRKTVENMIADGAGTFIEVGPGRVLSGLVSRISDKVRVCHVEDGDSLDKTAAEVDLNAHR